MNVNANKIKEIAVRITLTVHKSEILQDKAVPTMVTLGNNRNYNHLGDIRLNSEGAFFSSERECDSH